MCDDPVFNAFTSETNQLTLNQRVSASVFKITGIRIPAQQRQSVLIASTHVYSQHARHIDCPGAVDRQVAEMNDIAHQVIVENVLQNLEQHVTYLMELENNQKEKKLLSYPERSNDRERNETHRSFDYSV